MKKSLLLLTTILLWGGLLFADDLGGKFGIGAQAGTSAYYGDIGGNDFGLHYGLVVDYWFSKHFGAAFHYGTHRLKAEEGTNYFESDLWNYGILLRLNLLPSTALNPYLTAGFEWFDNDPKTKDGAWVPAFGQGISSGAYDRVNTAIPFGLGVFYMLNENFSIGAEGLIHYTSIDYVDGLEQGGKDDHWISLAVKLTLHLGKAKDTDGDGIPDKLDKAPLQAEDFDNFMDSDGAPDLDNDQDGIPDVVDKAPVEPEDRDGFEDDDGIPDPDNDNDGILDDQDKAPNQPEDMDGFMDADGVPDPDNDNDGIADVDDPCPNEAETLNGFEDADGCPDEKPEVAVEKGAAIVLEGVTFATGSARLTQNAKIILDKVVRTMTKNPDLVLEIRGYTDNTGSYNGNLRISQKRAESVMAYLVSKGITAERLSAQGFGPENPVAPNDTAEGRAQNRRIEFFRIQ